MGSNNAMIRNQYNFFSRPPNIPSSIDENQVQSRSQKGQKFKVIKGTNGESFRYYKKKIINREKDAEIYNWRNLTNKSIVKVMHIQILQSSSLQKLSVGIYTDHIFRYLQSIKNLSIAQTIYLLKKTLGSFQEVFGIYGFAKVDQECIGINQKGQCKVWITQNLCQNQMQAPTIKNQQSLITQIIKIIQETSNLQCQIFFKNFIKDIQQSHKYNFKYAENFINSYCQRNQITIPLYLRYEDPIPITSKPKLMRMTNKSQEMISFKKKSITTNFSSVNKTIQGESKSSIKRGGTKDLTQPRISIADRIPLIDKIKESNKENQQFSKKRGSESTKLLENIFSSKLGLNSNAENSQIKQQDIKNIGITNKRYSLGSPPKIEFNLSPLNKKLCSNNSLLLQIYEKDEQARDSPDSSQDSIIEEQQSVKRISWSKKSQASKENTSFNGLKNYQQENQSVKKYINISHQFSISIINDNLGSKKQSQNRSRVKTQVNSNSEQNATFRQKSYCTHCERFSSEESERMISQILSQDNKPRDNYLEKEVQSVTIINNSAIPSRKQMTKKLTRQSGKSKGNRYQKSQDDIEEEKNQSKLKKIQETVISSNNWKKILNKLLSSEKDMELKHSTSYEFQEDRISDRIPDQPIMAFQKLDRVVRHTRSIIPK